MRRPAVVGLLVALAGGIVAAGQPSLVGREPQYEETLRRDHPAVRDDAAAADDPLARLGHAIATGTRRLDVDPRLGVLPALLAALDVPADSQLLVFSKTSFQFPRISPQLPRALYFNDTVAVGVVPGSSVIELATMHPGAGARFYTLEGPTRADAPIVRRDVCLRCHHGVATLGVPGLFVSSVFPSSSGAPERDGAIVTDHRTRFPDRWGGWFVSGLPDGLVQRGNAVAMNPATPTALTPLGAGAGLRRVDASRYLSTTSDPIALMTLEHQTQGANLLLRLGWEARIAAHDTAAGGITPAAVTRRIDDVARYLLFLDEAPWPRPIAAVSTFANTYGARGPRDERGRSLRAFDLRTRLFRYRLSPLIGSPLVAALPPDVRARLLTRLFDALTGAAAFDGLARLDRAERTAILEIVRDTIADLPPAWRDFRAGPAPRR